MGGKRSSPTTERGGTSPSSSSSSLPKAVPWVLCREQHSVRVKHIPKCCFLAKDPTTAPRSQTGREWGPSGCSWDGSFRPLPEVLQGEGNRNCARSIPSAALCTEHSPQHPWVLLRSPHTPPLLAAPCTPLIAHHHRFFLSHTLPPSFGFANCLAPGTQRSSEGSVWALCPPAQHTMGKTKPHKKSDKKKKPRPPVSAMHPGFLYIDRVI